MIAGSYGIGFDVDGIHSIDYVKRGLHNVMEKMFGDYYNKHWADNRIYLELTTRNIFITNEDLTRACFNEGITALESYIVKEFNPSSLFACYLDDSTGGRGFSLLETQNHQKRIWIDSDFDSHKNAGEKIREESFIAELIEDIEVDGDEERKIYHHPEYQYPISGQRGIIEKVIRGILQNRFMYDYEWQKHKGDIELLETDDFPIQDLQLLYGGS